jgi:hypothetical protein
MNVSNMLIHFCESFRYTNRLIEAVRLVYGNLIQLIIEKFFYVNLYLFFFFKLLYNLKPWAMSEAKCNIFISWLFFFYLFTIYLKWFNLSHTRCILNYNTGTSANVIYNFYFIRLHVWISVGAVQFHWTLSS